MYKFKFKRTSFQPMAETVGEVVCWNRDDYITVLNRWNNMQPYTYVYAPMDDQESVNPDDYYSCSYGLTFIKKHVPL